MSLGYAMPCDGSAVALVLASASDITTPHRVKVYADGRLIADRVIRAPNAGVRRAVVYNLDARARVGEVVTAMLAEGPEDAQVTMTLLWKMVLEDYRAEPPDPAPARESGERSLPLRGEQVAFIDARAFAPAGVVVKP